MRILFVVFVFITSLSLKAQYVIDTTFGNNGEAVAFEPDSSTWCEDLAVWPNGSIIAVGLMTIDNPYNEFTTNSAVARKFTAEGKIDSSFGREGKSSILMGRMTGADYITPHLNDGFLLSGYFFPVNSSDVKTFIARFLLDGSIDTDFGIEGVIENESPFSTNEYIGNLKLTLSGDGFYAAGSFYGDAAIVKYTNDGKLNTDFGDQGMALVDAGSLCKFEDFQELEDGSILACGVGRRSVTDNEMLYVKFNNKGELVPEFANNGVGYYNFLSSNGSNEIATKIMVQKDGKFVLAGNSFDCIGLVRFYADGSFDGEYGVDGEIVDNKSSLIQSHKNVMFNYESGGFIKLINIFKRSEVRGIFLESYKSNGFKDEDFGDNGILTLKTGEFELFPYVTLTKGLNGDLLIGGAGNVPGDYTFSIIKLKPQTVGIDEVRKEAVRLYPNPANQYINIPTAQLGYLSEVIIYDALGHEVMKERAHEHSNYVIAHLPSGMYSCFVQTPNERVYVGRFVKE